MFDRIILSTDSAEIAAVSARETETMKRSKVNSDDFATLVDVVEEVLYNLNEKYNNFCCILPGPFTRIKYLKECYTLLLDGYDSVFPVVKYGHPIQRSLQFRKNKIRMLWKENRNKRTQDLTPIYHDAGQFYWMNIESFYKHKKLFTKDSGSIVIPEIETQDIDTEEDWKLAEMKYELSKSY